ncbi:MAG TPA: YbhB/YbcL family Raf kinase inhibitor-like protein [Planctomycetota bacterium]|nr:YbhB/YbcL family Raf kinase inhibitor-like protein [Planctomycetota bacterium]
MASPPAERPLERYGWVRLFSPDFRDGDPIPRRFSRAGGNSSPGLWWSDLPEGTASIALVLDDALGPQETPFTLWILFNVRPVPSGIPEGLSKVHRPCEVPGAEQGRNDAGRIGYDGPAPPRGRLTGRYQFRIYALDSLLGPASDVDRAEIQAAMEGHVLGFGRLAGTFTRPEGSFTS